MGIPPGKLKRMSRTLICHCLRYEALFEICWRFHMTSCDGHQGKVMDGHQRKVMCGRMDDG